MSTIFKDILCFFSKCILKENHLDFNLGKNLKEKGCLRRPGGFFEKPHCVGGHLQSNDGV
jgi:hypothetical protein